MSNITLPTWTGIFDKAKAENERTILQIDIDLAILSVRASWDAVGKSDQEILALAKEKLIRDGKI